MSLLFWGRSFSWVSAVLFEFASLLSGIDLPVGLSFFVWVSVSLLGGQFLNEPSFWGKPSCLVCDLLFGCQPSCWGGGICSMSPPSGANLFVGFLICCLGVSLPGASLLVGFLICCLGVSLPVGPPFWDQDCLLGS